LPDCIAVLAGLYILASAISLVPNQRNFLFNIKLLPVRY
jgi:hypothetical protein